MLQLLKAKFATWNGPCVKLLNISAPPLTMRLPRGMFCRRIVRPRSSRLPSSVVSAACSASVPFAHPQATEQNACTWRLHMCARAGEIELNPLLKIAARYECVTRVRLCRFCS